MLLSHTPFSHAPFSFPPCRTIFSLLVYFQNLSPPSVSSVQSSSSIPVSVVPIVLANFKLCRRFCCSFSVFSLLPESSFYLLLLSVTLFLFLPSSDSHCYPLFIFHFCSFSFQYLLQSPLCTFVISFFSSFFTFTSV